MARQLRNPLTIPFCFSPLATSPTGASASVRRAQNGSIVRGTHPSPSRPPKSPTKPQTVPGFITPKTPPPARPSQSTSRAKPAPTQKEDAAKKKPPVPVSTVTKFQSPVAVAYLNSSQQIVFKRGSVARIIPGKPGNDLSISHDGKKLLFTRDEGPGAVRSINQYDFDSNGVKELLRGNVRNPVWSPDDSRVAFLNDQDAKWQLWTFPSSDATRATVLSTESFDSIQGWGNAHTLLSTTANLTELAWIGEDGKPSQAIPLNDICAPGFRLSGNMTIRLHPSNPDLVVVSALFTHPPQGVPAGEKEGEAKGLFFYEFRSKRRVPLPAPNLAASNPEWSRDGFLVFFTGSDASHRRSTYRIFWDGIGLQKYVSGTGLVIGQ